jgi:TonB family protein
MVHGIDEFYLERTRFERRVSITTISVSLLFLGSLWLATVPAVRHRLSRDVARFGFEGRDQFVQRIMLEAAGPLNLQARRGLTLVQRQAIRGGTEIRGRSRSPHAIPVVSDHRTGPGESTEDLLTRARAIYRSAPVIQSEDLVIERLIRPLYPEDARNRNIEGKVALVALVDTSGHVASVDIMDSTGERELERAATEAMWQCRFRPYLVRGEVHEVYAVFRFSFRIY